jgi:cobaltochelatase CobS
MAYHHACYEAKFQKTAKKGVARYSSICQVCNQAINVGDAFTWTRRVSGNSANKPYKPFTADAVSANQAAEAVEMSGGDMSAATEAEDGDQDDSDGSSSSDSLLNPKALAKILTPHLLGKSGFMGHLEGLKSAGFGGLQEHEKAAILKAVATEVSEAINKAVADIPKPQTVEIVHKHVQLEEETTLTVDMGIQHKDFAKLLKAIQACKAHGRFGVYLAGPSGSGKTTAAENAAAAIGLPFFYTGAVGDQYALLGYMNATGSYVRTSFREAYEHGGVFLWDEIDASDPSALLAFNAALANGSASFPDGMVKRHANFIPIAAANTFGHGGTHEYVGRMKLDMAFLKRFAFLRWDYDWDMVRATCPNHPAWVTRVREVCEKVINLGIRVIVTPRECYIGSDLLDVGLDQDTVEEMTIRSGMTQEQWDKVRS